MAVHIKNEYIFLCDSNRPRQILVNMSLVIESQILLILSYF